MDMMLTAIIAVLITMIAVLIAIIAKKSKWTILLFAVIGLMIGIPGGYFLAPFIISFF
jgi:hypothetical protein